MTMERTVLVWNEDVEVNVYQKSKSVWVANGTYLGDHIEVKGRSVNSALALWRDAARYRQTNSLAVFIDAEGMVQKKNVKGSPVAVAKHWTLAIISDRKEGYVFGNALRNRNSD